MLAATPKRRRFHWPEGRNAGQVVILRLKNMGVLFSPEPDSAFHCRVDWGGNCKNLTFLAVRTVLRIGYTVDYRINWEYQRHEGQLVLLMEPAWKLADAEALRIARLPGKKIGYGEGQVLLVYSKE